MAEANPEARPQAPNAAEVILELSNELGVQVSELPNLPVEFLAGVIAASGRTNAEKAAQHLALFKLRAAEAPLQQDLAHYFRERDARELFPWKSAESAARVQHEAFRTAFAQEAPFENLKRIFVAQAKGGLIAPLASISSFWGLGVCAFCARQPSAQRPCAQPPLRAQLVCCGAHGASTPRDEWQRNCRMPVATFSGGCGADDAECPASLRHRLRHAKRGRERRLGGTRVNGFREKGSG